MDISFIVPVYKTPRHLLRDSLGSIVAIQDCEIEILCVIDSPGDECESVVWEIADVDSRVKVVKNDRNRGAAYSRNKALGIATGEFVSFVDSDDTIECEVYEEMFKVATRRRLSACSCKAVGEKRHCGVEYGKWGFERSPCTYAFQMGACAALWRSTCIKSNCIKFPEDLRHNEDFVFVTRFLQLGLPLGFYNKRGYNYIKRSESVTRSANSARLVLDQAKSAKYILDVLGKVMLNGNDARWYARRIMWNLFGDWGAVKGLADCDRNKYVELLSQVLPAYLASCGFAISRTEKFLVGLIAVQPQRVISYPVLCYWPLRVLMQIKARFANGD